MSDHPWLVSYKEWYRLEAAVELINKWEPNWKPVDDCPFSVYSKLDSMNLFKDFLKNYKEKLDGQVS